MKIVADKDINFISDYFGTCGELILKPGRQLTFQDVHDAKLLIIRSVTRVDKNLLQNSSVKFVGSVVTGVDHLDIEWLNQSGIQWAAAEGCNAKTVAEYIISVIASLQQQQILLQKKPRAAVIGVGKIGARVVEKLSLLGFECVLCDPFRAENEANFISTPLEKIADVDLITLHTPLTSTGKYPTFHMIEKNFLQRQKKDCVLLNTSRGSVIDFENLKKFGTHLHWCLDVWENEPHIDQSVLSQALIATPHIAGHSLQSKLRGVEMVYQAAFEKKIIPDCARPVNLEKKIILCDHAKSWRDVVLAIYDPKKTSELLKLQPNAFDQIRNTFNERYEFDAVNVNTQSLPETDIWSFL